jgi:membrane protein
MMVRQAAQNSRKADHPGDAASRQRYRIVEFARVCAGKFAKDRVSIMASGAVYTTLISLVPLVSFLMSFLTLFNVIQPFFSLLDELFVSILGEQAGAEFSTWIEEYSTKASGLGIVGFISFIITSVLLIDKVWTIVNHIYRTSPSRGKVWKRMLAFLTILIVGAALLVAYISIKSLLSARVANLLGWASLENRGLAVIRTIVPWFIVWVFIFLIIMAAPNTKVSSLSATLGALVGTVAVAIVNLVFSGLISLGFNYSVIYGSFAAIFLFLLWVYLMWIAILAAVEVSYVHQYRPDKISLTRPVSPAEQLANGINVMMVIGSNFRSGSGETRVKDIAEKLLMNDRELFSVIDMLAEKKFVIATNPAKTAYLPAKPLEDMKIVDLVSALYGEVYLEQNLDTIGDAIATQVSDKGIKTLGNLTIYNLLERI